MKKIAKTTAKKAAHKAAKKAQSGYLWAEVSVAIVGLILSVVFHELFHVLMHLDQHPTIGLFPKGTGAIAEIFVALPAGYDIEGEEIVAYIITFAVMLLTAAIIFRIHDAGDKRSTAQILFPKDKDMQNLSPQELLELADRANMHQIIHANHRKKGRL